MCAAALHTTKHGAHNTCPHHHGLCGLGEASKVMVYRGDSLHGVHLCDRDCYGECEKQAGSKNKTKVQVQNQHIRTSLTTTADNVEQISPWWHQTTQVTLSGTTYPEVTRDASLLSLVECAPPTPGAEVVCLDKNLRELIPGECECANVVFDTTLGACPS